jgi:Flp pilus assembly protein CpaB
VVFVPGDQLVEGSHGHAALVIGKVSMASILAGEPITDSRVVDRSVEVPAARSGGGVPPGLRAMALNIEPMSNGLNYVPGDREQVVAVYDGTVTTIAENVEILAMGQGPKPPGSVTVTVAVDVKQSEVLAEAQEKASKLYVTLRSTGQ